MENSETAQKNGNISYTIKDNKGCFLFVIVVLAIALAIAAYFLGKKNGTVTNESIISNTTFIKEVAELASLEANGMASIKSTNIADDGSFGDEMKKLFAERTVNIDVPYTAKYGVNLGKQTLHINKKDTIVTIILPNPQLLSYELRLDKLDASVRKGLLQSVDEQTLSRLESKLYIQSKAQMENNSAYKQSAKDKIRKILEAYYAPLKINVNLVFDDVQANKAIDMD